MSWHENAGFFLCLQTGVPPVAFGEPGTAKTRTTEAFARAVAREYRCVVGSHCEPCDITGYPHIDVLHGKKVQASAPTDWRVALEHAPNGGVLHLDELTDCAPAIQAAMLQLLTHGVPNTWLCATGNPEDCSTNGYALAPTTVNRLCVLKWRTPVKSWQEGMISNFQNNKQQFPILPENWDVGIGTARALVLSFCTKTHPEMLQKLPADASKRGEPWPSLRSWTNAATLLAACEAIHASAEIETELLEGCVGQAVALPFLQWRKKLDLPDPEALIANPKSYKPSNRGDVSHCVLQSVIAAVLRKNDKERWNAAWEILGIQCDVAPDIAATVAAPLSQNKPEPGISIPPHVQKKLLPILQALT